MKKHPTLLLALLTISAIGLASASEDRANYVKTSCEKFGAEGAVCNECFAGPTLYQGQFLGNQFLDFTASSNEQVAILANSPGNISTSYIQKGFVWAESKDMWEWDSKVFTAASPTRGAYVPLEPGQTISKFVRSKPDTSLSFDSGPRGGGSRDIPSFLLKYKTIFYTKASNFLEPKSNLSCSFFYSNWCGDGVRDPKEQCDLGEKNGINGSGCSSTCESN